MLEILFVYSISVYIFKISIYHHKKVVMSIVIILSTIMKSISLYKLYNNGNDTEYYDQHNLYNAHIWIIPVGIISFILIIFIRDYSYCRLKWLFDFKYISEIKILIIYGFIGSIFCFISCSISSNIQCKKNVEYINNICNVSYNNNIYYDHYLKYFWEIWNKDREGWINFIFVILILIKIFLSVLHNLFMVLIIKNLSPEYLICSKYIFYFITELIQFIISSYNEFNFYNLFKFLSEVFAIFGAFLYLEFIELKFCNLNYYLKRNIIKRSLNETSLDINNDNIEDDNSSLHSLD